MPHQPWRVLSFSRDDMEAVPGLRASPPECARITCS